MARRLVRGTPAPDAVLRPLKNPLYDTELIPSTVGVAQMLFFQIPIGQNFAAAAAAGVRAKTLGDTNMTQAAQLGTPREFDLFGFNCRIEDDGGVGVTRVDYLQIVDDAAFTFNFGVGRPWLQTQLRDIPAGCDEYMSAVDGAAALVECVQTGLSSTKEFYNFLVKKNPIRIRSQETFNVQLDWFVANPAPATDDIKVTQILRGILYSGL